MCQGSSSKNHWFSVFCAIKKVSSFVSITTEIWSLITVIKSEILMANFSPTLRKLAVALAVPCLCVYVSPLSWIMLCWGLPCLCVLWWGCAGWFLSILGSLKRADIVLDIGNTCGGAGNMRHVICRTRINDFLLFFPSETREIKLCS